MELINAELVVLKDRLCKIEKDRKNDDTSNDIKKFEKLCEKNNKILDKEIDVSSSRSQQVITIRDKLDEELEEEDLDYNKDSIQVMIKYTINKELNCICEILKKFDKRLQLLENVKRSYK